MATRADKVSSRVVNLLFYETAAWPNCDVQFVVRVDSSGNYYYGSRKNYTPGAWMSQRFSFASSVSSWITWWVICRRKSDNYIYAQILGPSFWVPM